MNDRPLLHDNPNDHDVLMLLVERFGTHMQNTNRALARVEETLTSLDEKVGVQNGNVARLQDRATAQDKRWNDHAEDHKDKIETPIEQLRRQQNESEIKRKFVLSMVAVFMAGISLIPAIYGAWTVLERVAGK